MKALDPREHVTPDTESEFEFSRRLIVRGVPHADLSAARARTWKRLQQSVERDAKSGWRAGGWQPSFTVAACALTFVFGVWVGKREQPVRHTPSVSAEPLAARGARHLANVQHGEGVVEAANAHVASVRGAGAEPHITLPSGSFEPRSVESGSLEPSSVVELSSVVEPSSVVDSESVMGSSGHVRAQSSVSSVVTKPQVSREAVDNVGGEPSSSLVEGPGLPPSGGSTAGGNKGVAARPTWQNLANKGEYEAALVEIAQAGGYERVLASASPEQLMLLSDVARATGQQQRALSALKRIVEQHTNDPVAPLAALNMGNLLDKMGDGAGATKAFARYRALSPKGEFAEDALVRQLRSAVKAGQQALARKLVHQYEADFPDGRSAGEVAQLADQLPEISVQADAGVESL